MHPANPDVLYAAAWERSRRPWDFVEGGDGRGIWKSADGGDTWTRLEGGLPQGEHVGRIGLTISAPSPDTSTPRWTTRRCCPRSSGTWATSASTPSACAR